MGTPLPERTIFRRILAPTDGSRPARAADAAAIHLAQAFGASLRFVYVLDSERLARDLSLGTSRDLHDAIEPLKPLAKTLLHEATTAASEAGVAAESEVLEGDVVDAILEDASAWRADVIIVGTHGRSHSLSPTLGGRTGELLRRSTLPVLVCR